MYDRIDGFYYPPVHRVEITTSHVQSGLRLEAFASGIFQNKQLIKKSGYLKKLDRRTKG